MNIHQKHLTNQIEISNLIEEAVVNASARRNQVLDTQEVLSELSEDEQKNITGGGVARDVIDTIIRIGGYLLG
ncbi:MAG: hypothetical protein KME52_20125 [Desmonostoc geniculatum HA4340-LM1]|nr:hypothetical protein [Nostoc calcicola FACHB-3891]MBW4676237.1 hypothetical protein [Desmonostoc geniculatum HA4340-LM1]OKH31028.1 hypothetical protein FACHB389_22550 [Nostoc calcicola FACHB-389]